MKPWSKILTRHGYHVIPNNDLVQHECNKACICGPRGDAFVGKSGTVEWIFLHESLDRREDRKT